MSTLDAGFYFVEHENVPMHIGSLVVLEGPAPAYEELIDLYAAKLPMVPRYRQVVRTVPMQVFRPFWADDEHFEIRYHVRYASVPAPGGQAEVRALAARLLAQRLNRARPLWEAWLLDGIAGDRWGLLSKVHHCVVDGIAGTDLLTKVCDLSPEFERPVPQPWTARPAPSAASLVSSGILDTATWRWRQLAGVPGFVRHRLASPAEALRFGWGLTAGARRLASRAPWSLNGPIGPDRNWAWTTVDFGDVKRIRREHGGTVNDVLLAAITRGFRDLLAERGELTRGLVVRSLVPVSVRGQDEHAEFTNRVSAVLANLPVGEPGPMRRLTLLREQMSDIKRTHQAVGPEFLTEMLGFVAPTVLALGSRAAFGMGQPLVQTVTTNVPGPSFPLYILGHKMVESYPYVPIGDNVHISIAIFSYLGCFYFGITSQKGEASDVEALTRGITTGVAELIDLGPGAALAVVRFQRSSDSMANGINQS